MRDLHRININLNSLVVNLFFKVSKIMKNKIRTYDNTRCFFHLTTSKSVIYIAIICIVALILSTKGIMDEATISLNGDQPRHMMKGVYFRDELG